MASGPTRFVLGPNGGDLPGGFLGTVEVAGSGRFGRGGGSPFPLGRGSSPVRPVRGASSSFLHTGRVGSSA